MTIETGKSWADESTDTNEPTVPPSSEVFENGQKIMTEYKLNEDTGKMTKYVRTYKVEKRLVSKAVAQRKTWHKFGDSVHDKLGPNPGTTLVADDVYMHFITNKEEDNKQEEDGLDKLKSFGDKTMIKCRHCSGDHWTSQCPWKDVAQTPGKQLLDDRKGTASGTVVDGASSASTAALTASGSAMPISNKYIPPSLRDGAGRRDLTTIRRDDTAAIRISNLSESTCETDVEDLVKMFGPIQKLFLAKDKSTGVCKGFAFVHFKFRADAQQAIRGLCGHGYDHLILDADWSTPKNN